MGRGVPRKMKEQILPSYILYYSSCCTSALSALARCIAYVAALYDKPEPSIGTRTFLIRIEAVTIVTNGRS
jgi:hypothetical protein